MAFTPGVSGNPGGRPKIVTEIRKRAQEASVEALETLLAIMRDADKATERATAARTILQLGGISFSEEGATAPVERPNLSVVPMSRDELIAIARGDA